MPRPFPLFEAIARRGAGATAITVAIVLALLAGAVASACAATGIRLFSIQTPSMGQTAPVGSLVVAEPADSYSVGDVITFTTTGRTVTHRLVSTSSEGFTTQGDLNGAPDGWTVAPADVIGRAVAILPGVGFLLTAAPWLLLGAVLTEALTWVRHARTGWVWSVRLVGWSVTVTAVTFWLRPWFDVRLLDFRPTDDGGGALLHVVNTGLLPVLADTTRLVSGQDAVVTVTDRLANGAFSLTPVIDPDLPVRLLLIALCLLPFLAALLVRESEPAPTATGLRARPDRRARAVLLPLAVVTVVSVVALTTFSLSGAAFGATIRNTSDAAGTNPFFTCRDAESSVGTSSTWGAYAVSGTNVTGQTENDLSGLISRRATWAKKPVASASIGCQRDSPANSVTFDGSQCLYVPRSASNPNTFTLEAWFRTSSTSNGKIIGFGAASQSAADFSWDRHVYLDSTGRVVFGVYPNKVVTISTPAGRSYADGQWHAVVASLSAGGMALYVDGSLVAANASITTAQDYDGYWKIGCGNLSGWANGTSDGTIDYSGPSYFTGQIQYAAIYTRALTAKEVRWHYVAGR